MAYYASSEIWGLIKSQSWWLSCSFDKFIQIQCLRSKVRSVNKQPTFQLGPGLLKHISLGHVNWHKQNGVKQKASNALASNFQTGWIWIVFRTRVQEFQGSEFWGSSVFWAAHEVCLRFWFESQFEELDQLNITSQHQTQERGWAHLKPHAAGRPQTWLRTFQRVFKVVIRKSHVDLPIAWIFESEKGDLPCSSCHGYDMLWPFPMNDQ